MKNRIIGFLSLALVSALIACSVPNKTYSRSLNKKDSVVINSLFDDAPTYCLGRYTFNYPQALAQELSSIIRIDDMTIESEFIYPPAFKQRIELRENALRNQRVSDESDGPFLKNVVRLDKGVIFDKNESYAYSGAVRELEAHVYIDNVAFVITTKFTDITAEKYKKRQERYKRDNRLFTNEPQKMAAMKSLISRLHGRPKNQIPTEKGVCIPYGFIQDDSSNHKFKFSMLFQNNQFAWSIVMDNLLGSEEESLLERSSEIKPIMRQLGASTLKKGAVQYNKIPGEEWLIHGKEDGDKKYRFQYNANEKNVTYLQPSVQILLHNSGILTVKNYNDEQMVEIWDRILQSFKTRPNAY